MRVCDVLWRRQVTDGPKGRDLRDRLFKSARFSSLPFAPSFLRHLFDLSRNKRLSERDVSTLKRRDREQRKTPSCSHPNDTPNARDTTSSCVSLFLHAWFFYIQSEGYINAKHIHTHACAPNDVCGVCVPGGCHDGGRRLVQQFQQHQPRRASSPPRGGCHGGAHHRCRRRSVQW